MTTLSELRSRPHLSISQLKVFLQCPRKYRLQYIDRVVPSFRAIALAFGSAWHEAVGVYFDPSHQPELDELEAVFRDSLVGAVHDDGPPVLFDDDEGDLGATVDAGLRMLRTFVTRVTRPVAVLGLEQPFGLEIADRVTGEVHPHPLIGAIDAITRDHGQVEVLELKTAKRRWSRDQVDFDIQVTAYGMAARRLGHVQPVLKLLVTTKAKVADVQVEQPVRTGLDEHELVQLALGMRRATLAGYDVPLRGWTCRTCPFAGACVA